MNFYLKSTVYQTLQRYIELRKMILELIAYILPWPNKIFKAVEARNNRTLTISMRKWQEMRKNYWQIRTWNYPHCKMLISSTTNRSLRGGFQIKASFETVEERYELGGSIPKTLRFSRELVEDVSIIRKLENRLVFLFNQEQKYMQIQMIYSLLNHSSPAEWLTSQSNTRSGARTIFYDFRAKEWNLYSRLNSVIWTFVFGNYLNL